MKADPAFALFGSGKLNRSDTCAACLDVLCLVRQGCTIENDPVTLALHIDYAVYACLIVGRHFLIFMDVMCADIYLALNMTSAPQFLRIYSRLEVRLHLITSKPQVNI